MSEILVKWITYSGRPAIVACDANCKKAWGVNLRPKVMLSENEDDYAFLADGELGEAPAYPGSWEGQHTKPQKKSERLNKWCVRECERSVMKPPGETLVLPDFGKRRYNLPGSDPNKDAGKEADSC